MYIYENIHGYIYIHIIIHIICTYIHTHMFFFFVFELGSGALLLPPKGQTAKATDLRGKEKAKNNETVTDAKVFR